MIGYINGEVLNSDGKKILIKTEFGLGYEINFAYYANIGEKLEVFVHHHITDSDQSLWGFKTLDDKKVFELLKSVNKVGASKAYVLLTQVGRDNVLNALTYEQVDVLTQASGIGKKMAEQIILSLKDKVNKLEFAAAVNTQQDMPMQEGQNSDRAKIISDALAALESLGYKDKSVQKIINENLTADISSSEELIKIVLKEI
tara:strand:- start:73640 stop:74242 length:603 start_codon:yes stop_codon:yes gene_type:complete